MNTVINEQSLVPFGGKIPRKTHVAVKKFVAERGITLNKFYNEALLSYLRVQGYREEPFNVDNNG
ncbi:MAG: hypothetical protein JEY71_11780 [Sphaerochaeta sp.]|nr:hypothetical protein [Sphaerochaeta sp.]